LTAHAIPLSNDKIATTPALRIDTVTYLALLEILAATRAEAAAIEGSGPERTTAQ
jgi:hypothetical protein